MLRVLLYRQLAPGANTMIMIKVLTMESGRVMQDNGIRTYQCLCIRRGCIVQFHTDSRTWSIRGFGVEVNQKCRSLPYILRCYGKRHAIGEAYQ